MFAVLQIKIAFWLIDPLNAIKSEARSLCLAVGKMSFFDCLSLHRVNKRKKKKEKEREYEAPDEGKHKQAIKKDKWTSIYQKEKNVNLRPGSMFSP